MSNAVIRIHNKLFELTREILNGSRRLIVAGDIHGDWVSCHRICDIFDPKQDFLIFLGDYADRGEKGIEVIDKIRELVEEAPDRVILLKGNHEDYSEDGRPRFMPSNLIQEAQVKKGGWRTYYLNELKSFLDKLYLAAIIPNEILFVHGGISSKLRNMDDLRYPSKRVEIDILWSDPFEGLGEHSNIRGVGVEFGSNISKEVCERLEMKRVVRSHQPRKARMGPCIEHDGRIITVSSTDVYGGLPFILSLSIDKIGNAFNQSEYKIMSLR